MRRLLIMTAIVGLFGLAMTVSTTCAVPRQAPLSGHADIVNAQGQKVGTATIHPSGSGVRIDVEVSQLPPGTHGIHIHTVGKCEGPAFTSAGDRKSTRLNSSHRCISYAVFCLKKKK